MPSRYRLNEATLASDPKADPGGTFPLAFSTTDVTKVRQTDPIPKEGQGCYRTSSVSNGNTSVLGMYNVPYYQFGYIDMYFYNASSSNADNWFIVTAGHSGYGDIFASVGLRRGGGYGTGAVIHATYDAVSATYVENVNTGLNSIPQNKWCRINIPIGIDYGGGAYGTCPGFNVWTSSNLYSLTPDYTYYNSSNSGYSEGEWELYVGPMDFQTASPQQNGAFIDDVIISDAPIVRKKAKVGFI